MFEPIGPLPPEIYWRRRAVAIGVIVILVVALIWLVSSLRGGGETPEADNAVSTSDLTLPAPSSSSSASTSKSAAPQSGTSTTPTGVSGGANVGQPADTSKPAAPPAPGGAPGQCPDQSLAVKATVENPTYKVAMGQILTDPPISEPEDIANAVLFLSSDESRTITGAQIPVDHGATKV